MNIAGLDIFFLIIIAGMSILGLISGFVKEFFSKAAVFLGLLMAILFFKKFSNVLARSISSAVLCQIMSFLIIFLVVYLLIKILQRLIGSIFENETMQNTIDNSESVIDKMSAEEIFNLIRNLPVGCRTVFNLHIIEDKTHKEIADVLGITEGTSKSQLSKARKMLQNAIQKNNTNSI